MRLVLSWLMSFGLLMASANAPYAQAGELGANKFDLLLQYTGRASGGDGSPAYLHVTRAMGEKAILDAKDAGITFFRVSASGFFPVEANGPRPNDLTLWLADPQAYWRLVDRMFDDLDRTGIRLVPCLMWNLTQFPAAAGESKGALIRDPDSKSRLLLQKYISDFVSRYRTRKTILFYELSNELNLQVDLDLNRHCMSRVPAVTAAHCSVEDSFSTAEMIDFSQTMVSFIKQLDPRRQVASGFALPRSSAYHLEHQPEFSPRGPDWTVDTIAQFDDNLARTQAPFDIVSVHVYRDPADVRFGRPVDRDYEIIGDVATIARASGKKLFLGEFGDSGDGSFTAHVIHDLADNTVDYAGVWIWEFYQFATNQSFNTNASSLSLEPGFTDTRIGKLKAFSQKTTGDGNGTEAPRVVLTWPLPCSRVAEKTDLSAVASGVPNDPVDHVDFLVDGKILGTAVTPPFRIPFDPAASGDKRALLEARVTSRGGVTSLFQNSVLLNRSNDQCSP